MSDHTNLAGWKRSHVLVLDIARSLSAETPRRMPGLRAQLLRSAASIASNIAEGASRRSKREYAQFLTIAIGSASETENHLTLAVALHCIRGEPQELLREVRRIRAMLFKLRAYMEKSDPRSG